MFRENRSYKNACKLRFANSKLPTKTAPLSNIGQRKIPDVYEPRDYIRSFILTSTPLRRQSTLSFLILRIIPVHALKYQIYKGVSGVWGGVSSNNFCAVKISRMQLHMILEGLAFLKFQIQKKKKQGVK